jgi:hypothetical protein
MQETKTGKGGPSVQKPKREESWATRRFPGSRGNRESARGWNLSKRERNQNRSNSHPLTSPSRTSGENQPSGSDTPLPENMGPARSAQSMRIQTRTRSRTVFPRSINPSCANVCLLKCSKAQQTEWCLVQPLRGVRQTENSEDNRHHRHPVGSAVHHPCNPKRYTRRRSAG